MSDKDSLKPLLESLIFASESAVSLDRILSVLEGEEKAVVKEAVEELMEYYKSSGRGIFIEEVAGGYQFRTNPESSPWLRKLFKIGMQKISKAAMESLAIIAYKQPVTRGELEAIRGVDSGGVLATLMEKRFIKIVGRKEVPGRPVVYGTTKEFLETFDLKDLSCLPSLKDIQKMEEEHAAETQGYEGAAESSIENPVQDETNDKAGIQNTLQERSPAGDLGEEEDLDREHGEDRSDEGPGEDPFEGDFGEEDPGAGGNRKASEDNSLGGDNIEEEGGGADNTGPGHGKPGDGN